MSLSRKSTVPPSLTTTNERVRVFPSAPGVVRLVGMTSDGQWVCEHACLAVDFSEADIEGVERKVCQHEARRLRIV